MPSSFAFFVALRYLRSSQNNRFISLMGLISMLGIALGVMTLITVLSLMNGFNTAIQGNFFKVAQQILITPLFDSVTNWPMLEKKIAANPHITGISPFANGQGLLVENGQSFPAVLLGILPEHEKKTSQIATSMTQGKLEHLKAGGNKIVLSRTLADRLSVTVGDSVNLILPTGNSQSLQAGLKFVPLKVAGIFYIGEGAKYADPLVFVHLSDAQKILKLGHNIHGFRIKVDNLGDAPQIAKELSTLLSDDYQVLDWTKLYGAYFESIALIKRMLFFVLLLIVAVAAFNMSTKLVMLVADKQAEIAILRTLGASSRTILSIFLIQGLVIGCCGTALGLVAGILLSWHLSDIIAFIQHTFHIKLIARSVYMIDSLPAELVGSDIIRISALALVMSLVSALYPAYRAIRLQPAKVLRSN